LDLLRVLARTPDTERLQPATGQNMKITQNTGEALEMLVGGDAGRRGPRDADIGPLRTDIDHPQGGRGPAANVGEASTSRGGELNRLKGHTRLMQNLRVGCERCLVREFLPYLHLR
jgi:hypothetical protein